MYMKGVLGSTLGSPSKVDTVGALFVLLYSYCMHSN